LVQLIDREAGTPNPPQTLTVRSEILGQDRRIYVQLPSDYDRTNRAYPMLVVLDGEWLFDLARSHVRFYSEHQAMGFEIPKMIVVGIENLDRDPDYVPTPDPADEPVFPTAGKADKFLSFLRDELVPLIETDYRVAPSRTVVGWSFGGLCALYSALAMPELFDAYLCIGPAIWWDDELVVKRFEAATFDRPKRMVITLGADEVDGWVYGSTRKLLAQLEAHPIGNLDVVHLEFEGAGHSQGIPPAFAQGLRALFPGYRPTVEGEGFSLDDLKARYGGLSEAWGFDVEPSASVVLLSAQYRQKAGQPERALEILDWFLERCETASLIHFYRGSSLSDLGRDVEGLSAFRTALDVELQQAVPDGVYVRGFEARIAKISGQSTQEPKFAPRSER